MKLDWRQPAIAAGLCGLIAVGAYFLDEQCADVFRDAGIGIADPPIYNCPADIPREILQLISFSFPILALIFLAVAFRNSITQ
ncbi:hypothetical protein [Qipengyuania gelatinilytica]|uniref:Uncharacterized protein n=1 Tax=Qipengyuania gelatinilytica TaxID=2867231 RepID=A0ABX9A328_9SPHN|nr:hypothetical protein [Qipengyuania gelatinilytica]QZD95529.1 hypothetical protein K3136_02030 [Qipengyuania gelatinilytica]